MCEDRTRSETSSSGHLSIHEQHFQPSILDVVVPDAENITSDSLSPIASNENLSKEDELNLAIDKCKELILKCEVHSKERADFVDKLVQYRLQLQKVKEGVQVCEISRRVCGHKFKEQERTGRNSYCERCMCVIWRPIQQWFRCSLCGYRSHAKCLHVITRKCAGVRAREKPQYILDIRPMKGLCDQNYQCYERGCCIELGFEPDSIEPRLCDYDGRFYCPACHWNDVMIIPARVAHNWQFTPYPVSRANKQLLEILYRKPLINMEKLNPALFRYLEELRMVKKYRSDILLMKCYFMFCKAARKLRILCHLKSYQHFVEGCELYSLRDLVNLNNGKLLPQLKNILNIFSQHIRHDCLVCQGNAFVCEFCSNKAIIFPFDDGVSHCSTCMALFHRPCFYENNVQKICPRCDRREKRAESLKNQPDFTPPEEIYDPKLNPFEQESRTETSNNPFKDSLNPFEQD